jgi:hypothetical protein
VRGVAAIFDTSLEFGLSVESDRLWMVTSPSVPELAKVSVRFGLAA